MGSPGQLNMLRDASAGPAGLTPASGIACGTMKLQNLKRRIVAALDYLNGVDRTDGRSGSLLAGDFKLMRCTMAR